MHKLKVIIIQKSFSDYRKGIFDRLNRKYDFLLLHSKSNNGIKQIQTNYSRKVKKITYWKKNTSVYLFCLKIIRQFKPDVIIHEFTPSILSLFVIVLFKNILKYKIILWGHGFDKNKKFSTSSIPFKLRRWLIKHADAVLFYGNRNKNIINSVIPDIKYFVAPNTLDTYNLKLIYKQLSNVEKKMIKEQLAINYKHVLIYIGRLLEEKILPEYFIAVVIKVINTIKDTGVYIIGDGPCKTKVALLAQKNNIKEIHFLGAIHNDEIIGKYLVISDLLIMPGYVGLAVNHAFSFNTPVVTFEEGSNGPYHSPEIEYVESGKTGYLAKSMDVNDMINFIINYLKNKELQMFMKNEIKKTIQTKCSIEKMESGFVEAINYCLKHEE